MKSENNMDLSDLPVEIIELIAGYLSLKDICSCSAVSTRWRNAFDSNRVWKRFCTFHPKYFDVQINKLECTEGIDFYKGCEARERFFKELFVRRNLVNGNNVMCLVKGDDFFIDSVLDIVDDLGNHWLFCSCMEGRRCANEHFLQVWNLNDTPVLHTSVQTPLGREERLFHSHMKMIADKLIFSYQEMVLVYLFAPPHYQLELVHQYSLASLSSSAPHVERIVYLGCNIVQVSQTRTNMLSPSVPLLVEVWDIEGNLIFRETVHNSLSELNCYRPPWDFDGIQVASNDFDWLTIGLNLANDDDDELGFCVRVFNVQRLQILKFSVVKLGFLLSVDMSATIVCVCYAELETNHINIACYNSDTGQAVYDCVLGSPVTVRDTFNFAKQSCFPLLSAAGELIVVIKNIVHVYSIKSKSKIIQFDVHGKVFDIKILTTNLLLIQYICDRPKVYKCDVWNFKSGQKLYNLDYSESGHNNEANFTFIQNYLSPPKLIAVTSSKCCCRCYNAISKVFVSSLW